MNEHRRPWPRSRLPLRDLGSEALAGLLQRPGRSVLTMLGTTLGTAAFVAVLGLTATASGQIDKRFTVLAATEVVVQDIGSGDPVDASLSFTADASERVQRLNGTVHGGVYWTVPLRGPILTSTPAGDARTAGGLGVTAASPEALAAMHPAMKAGRLYDAFHSSRAEPVALLGSAAAARLGFTRLDGHPAVFINGRPYTVLGIIDSLQRHPEMLLNVILPATTALAVYGPPADQRAEMLIETRAGAATLIASQAALALRPDAPSRFKVLPPPDPKSLRGNVTSDLNVLFLLLAAICLVIGAVGIANTTLVSVLERINEIGLRRSLGARRTHIAGQFLTESTSVGLLGSLLGGCLGVGVVVAAAVAHQWTPILAPWTIAAAPGIGALVGLAAGVYPALRAAWIEPAEALRR